jgi:rfaE bifunctional protein kinase chain/domain/rfaE bifunctional protein nucleotidyltransferase chain/domain
MIAQHRPRVAVVGDVMLDGWWRGRTERLTREAPAMVVELAERDEAPGGAANVAVNLAALGAEVRLVGAVGGDEAGERLCSMLEQAGVDLSGVRVGGVARTVTKNRVVSGDQVLLRLDEVAATAPAEPLVTELVAALDGVDALLISSYGPIIDAAAVTEAFGRAGRPGLVVVDAHNLSLWAGLGPDLATPNAREAYTLLGHDPRDALSRVDGLFLHRERLLRATGASTVVVTLDRDGSLLLGGDLVHRTLAIAAPEQHASGAGDTFVAALTSARIAGLTWPDAVDLAQAAADVVVQRFGTSVCSTADLTASPGDRGQGEVLAEDDLLARIAAERALGRRIVMTNGCFDVLHRGHTTSLARAAALGDVLVVAVNSDDSTRRLKGPQRPINSELDRAAVLAALGCVDYVVIFDTDTPIPLLERLRPDVYAKGGDYSPDMLAEAEVVRAYGGEVHIVDYVPEHSTTEIVDRIQSHAALR